MPASNPLNALANVHRVTTRVGGRPTDVFVFDHHRSAFPLWTWAARDGPLTLVTFDRHMDLATPAAHLPAPGASLADLDGFARTALAARNDDHVVAALEAGAIADAVVVARSHQPPSLDAFRPFRDRASRSHRFAFARTLAEAGPEVLEVARGAQRIALDVDLDCFTTLSDADPDEVVTWDAEQIDAFLRCPESEAFWDAVLPKVALVTLAREPYHCGGLARGARLWAAFSQVWFGRLLGVPEP